MRISVDIRKITRIWKPAWVCFRIIRVNFNVVLHLLHLLLLLQLCVGATEERSLFFITNQSPQPGEISGLVQVQDVWALVFTETWTATADLL